MVDISYDLINRSLSLKVGWGEPFCDFKETKLCTFLYFGFLNLSSESNKTYVTALEYVYLSTYSCLPTASQIKIDRATKL